MVKVNRESFVRSLESVAPGLAQRELAEHSSCFVFSGGEVFAFNEEVLCRCPSGLGKEAEGAVPAKKLMEQIIKWGDEEIDVDFRDSEMVITGKGGRRQAGIRMEEARGSDGKLRLGVEVVELPKAWAKLPDSFTEAVGVVQSCVAKDQGMLTPSVCVHVHPKFVEACDGYQVCRWRLKTGISASTLVRQSSIKNVITLGMSEFAETDGWLHYRNPNKLIMSCRQYREHKFQDMAEHLNQTDGVPVSLPKGLEEAAEKARVCTSGNTLGNDQITVTLKPGWLIVWGHGLDSWFREKTKVDYKGKPMKFLISPQLLGEIAREHSECTVSHNRLRIEGDKWVFVVCLAVSKREAAAVVQEENANGDDAGDPE